MTDNCDLSDIFIYRTWDKIKCLVLCNNATLHNPDTQQIHSDNVEKWKRSLVIITIF